MIEIKEVLTNITRMYGQHLTISLSRNELEKDKIEVGEEIILPDRTSKKIDSIINFSYKDEDIITLVLI